MAGNSLNVTMLDVGWGDSILIEASDGNQSKFALVDSNDTTNYPSSLIFLKRHFERKKYHPFPRFEHVFATHAHADHINGLQSMLRTFGATNFYYSQCNTKNNKNLAFANLLRWAKKAKRKGTNVITNHKDIAQNDSFTLGPVQIDVLWPPFNSHLPHDRNDENNNSLVLALTLDKVCFLLTGDCVADNWDTTKPDHVNIPADTSMAQHPHHGAKNGLFDAKNGTPMLDQIVNLNTARKKQKAEPVTMCLSSHIRPHNHPKKAVIAELDSKNITYYRTDLHSHTTFRTDGAKVEVCYSHV